MSALRAPPCLCPPKQTEPIQRRADVLRDGALADFAMHAVSLATGVNAGEIAAATRHRADAARARQIAMYMAHTAWGWPLARVATAFGRDRSTAAYACQRIEDQREDRAFDERLTALEACMRAVPRLDARL